MRSLVVAIGLIAFASAADARPKKPTATKAAKAAKPSKSKKSAKLASRDRRDRRDKSAKRGKGRRIAHAARERELELRGPVHGQSLGAPWAGRLRDATQLPDGEGYFIRRPWRSFGTRSTVEAVYHIIGRVREQFPDMHVLAVGDLSAEHGGRITDHSSHQSGRDIDIGLIYYKKPAGYPESFVVANEDTLDCEATYHLIDEAAKTGRVQMMFLDYKLQGMIVEWARANDIDEDHLERLFQYTHGRGMNVGMVRHEPNHADHVHVRFKCSSGDTACR
jgi:murein endopeptidase